MQVVKPGVQRRDFPLQIGCRVSKVALEGLRHAKSPSWSARAARISGDKSGGGPLVPRPSLPARFRNIFLKFARTMFCGVQSQNFLARPPPDPPRLSRRQFSEMVQNLLRRPREQNLALRLKKLVKARPNIADHRRPARGRFEQPHAR